MKSLMSNCKKITFQFPQSNSFKEKFWVPQILLVQDGTAIERMQRWLIDKNDFYNTTWNSLSNRSLNNYGFHNLNSNTIFVYAYLRNNFFVASMAGQFFYFCATSMLFRSIELFCQSLKNPLNFTVFSPKIKQLINLFIMPAVMAYVLYLGYVWKDLAVIGLPVLLEKVLSFTWSNYFKQMHALSSNKDFEWRDFLLKNIQSAVLRLIPNFLLILSSTFYFRNYNPAQINVCTEQDTIKVDFDRASSYIEEAIMEPFVFILGKMFFDLVYIIILKTFLKDADLRDPMGWIFSKYSRAPVSQDLEIPEMSTRKKNFLRKPNTSYLKQPTVKNIDPNINTICEPQPSMKSIQNEQETIVSPELVHNNKKTKIKTRKTEDSQPVAKTNGTLIKPKTCIKIEVKGSIRIFQKIECSFLNKEVWAVVIADSTERQKLAKYEQLLSNGTIGGGVRQLTGWSDRYEIGADMNSRLIGKLYDNGIYHSLQGFMHMEEALQFSQQLESQGIPDNVSLIVFSSEAKKHKDIARVANSL